MSNAETHTSAGTHTSAETHAPTGGDGPSGAGSDEHDGPEATVRVLGHVTQENGELTEDAVEVAVIESTAVAEDGGVRSVEVDDDDRIVWVAPLPDDLVDEGPDPSPPSPSRKGC
jgi:hypothetical protein